jgi:hypothetical protein
VKTFIFWYTLSCFDPPYMLRVHCVAHWTNLVVQTLSKLILVAKIEIMLQSTYTYYSFSLNWYLDKCKLGDFLEQNVLKILCNVNTCWIPML